MRDPMTWSFPLGRMFGIAVRVHVLLPLVMLGLILRALTHEGSTVSLGEAGLMMVLLFVSVLLHEFGHCFAARSVDGDASEILMWPLGGLAYCDVPHTPWANFITVIGGPAVTLPLCVVAGGALACATLVPPLNPVTNSPYFPMLKNWREGIEYGNHHIPGEDRYYRITETPTGQVKEALPANEQASRRAEREAGRNLPLNEKAEPAKLQPWQVFAAR